jgi:hypothetical protein
MKFTEEQWKLYNYLKSKDHTFEEEKWVMEHFPLASSSSKNYARCPLCGYETNSTNVHRKCPLAPLRPNDEFIDGEKLSVYAKLASLNMIDVVGKGQQRTGYVPRGWKELQWRKDITPEQWDKIIAKQDFVRATSEYEE